MKRIFLMGCVLILSSFTFYVSAQGCSDAGACSIPAFKPSQDMTALDKMNQVNVGLSAGVGDHSIFVLTPQIGYTRKLGSWLSFDSRITGSLHSGNGIAASGLGDVFLNLNFMLSSKFFVTGGVKIPLNRADKYYADDMMFPMDYQPGLGTLDLITGIGIKTNNDWQFSLAFQKPLVQNLNLFEVTDPESPFIDFPPTSNFERQGDLLLHITKLISFSERITLSPGLLPIYHLAEDKYIDSFGVKHSIEGSSGLTLNATLHAIFQVNDSGELGLNVGFPLVVRKARPDGLTRSFVVGIDYSISF